MNNGRVWHVKMTVDDQSESVASRWTFGVSVVASLALTVIWMGWMIFSLPSDTVGGVMGLGGVIAVGAIRFVVDLTILEAVRGVFLRFTRR